MDKICRCPLCPASTASSEHWGIGVGGFQLYATTKKKQSPTYTHLWKIIFAYNQGGNWQLGEAVTYASDIARGPFPMGQ